MRLETNKAYGDHPLEAGNYCSYLTWLQGSHSHSELSSQEIFRTSNSYTKVFQMVQLVLMGMWQETGAPREKKWTKSNPSEIVHTHTHTHKDASSSASFSKPLLNTSVHVHAQCSPTPLPPKKETGASFCLLCSYRLAMLQIAYYIFRGPHVKKSGYVKHCNNPALQNIKNFGGGAEWAFTRDIIHATG